MFLAIAVDNLANAQELTAAEEQAAAQALEEVSFYYTSKCFILICFYFTKLMHMRQQKLNKIIETTKQWSDFEFKQLISFCIIID